MAVVAAGAVAFVQGITVATAGMDHIMDEGVTMVAILEGIIIIQEVDVVAWIVKTSSVAYVVTKFVAETVKMSMHVVTT